MSTSPPPVLPGLHSVQKLDWPRVNGTTFLSYSSDQIRATSRVFVSAFEVAAGKPHTGASGGFIVEQVTPFDGGVRIKIRVDHANALPIGTNILVLN